MSAETFGPEYVRPAQADCPRCACCTAALCDKGRNSITRCAGSTPQEHRQTVEGCPCSAETTQRTAAWRAAQVRATRLARELPLLPECEALLRELATGRVADDPAGVFPQLKLRGLGQLVHARPAITPLGHTYLAARDDARATTGVRVVAVDEATRTAQVEVPGWRQSDLATVLLDQVVTDSGLNAASLPGVWLVAEANCQAPNHDRLVLTGFHVPAPAPAAAAVADGGETA
ncbi:hypothetical protein RVR_4402 [Actinacidiphila reveromycinica]|uniref:Uncharacterized protein n=1 Tax=Actinacidiphila reveromycinica TaxID=659352 RepID=A0A7U3UT27_9ACTN|nr:hypothetical protein [Streptomyces sp. SN-593]BBA98272.1 hypothetical protein RVR_4402 [Streptomyces sp. SN-593]